METRLAVTPRSCFLLCIGALAAGLSGLAAADLRFQDRSSASGIGFRHQAGATPEKHLVETMGGGVALADFDNDGFLDIFFVNGGTLAGAATGCSSIGRDPNSTTGSIAADRADPSRT